MCMLVSIYTVYVYRVYVCVLYAYIIPGIYPDITSIPAGLRSSGNCRPVNRLKAPPTILHIYR